MNAFPEMQDLKEHINANPIVMHKLHHTAVRIAGLIEAISPLIQEHTNAVCPSCESVCCINRHLHYTAEDIIIIHLLEEQVPVHNKDAAQNAPCQFLGKLGCTIKRSLRPYRCNWFFCNPLLEQLQSQSAARYRQFVDALAEITRTRTQFIETVRSLMHENPASASLP